MKLKDIPTARIIEEQQQDCNMLPANLNTRVVITPVSFAVPEGWVRVDSIKATNTVIRFCALSDVGNCRLLGTNCPILAQPFGELSVARAGKLPVTSIGVTRFLPRDKE